MPSLKVRCDQCKIAPTCPRRGSSPKAAGSKSLLCVVVGGYSRDPVSRDILSEESRAASDRDGPCLTLAEVPAVDPDSGHAYFETVKVFHHPIRHARETSNILPDAMLPRSYAREKPRR